MQEPQHPSPFLLKALGLDVSDIGSLEWNRAHNADLLTVTKDGHTVEWDPQKRPPKGERPSVWVPASTCLHLHSGSFHWDFVVERMGKAQIGVGFMLLWNVGPDWGFFGYLGASPTAWAYDPSTGDVVRNTKSIEPGLPEFAERGNGVVTVLLDLPREAQGSGRFLIDGVYSRPIPLPPGAVVLPAACLLQESQRVTLGSFERGASLSADGT